MDMNKPLLNTSISIKALIRKHIHKSALFLATLILASQASFAADRLLDGVAAVVNDDIIMMSTVRQLALRLKASSPKTPDNELIKAAMEQLVLRKVQVQKGKELGIVVDDVMLNSTVENIAKQNKLGLPDFKVALQKQGIEYNTFREDVRVRLVIDALKKRQSGNSAVIMEQEVKDLIFSQANKLNKDVQFELQEILIPAPNGTPLPQFNQARQQAQQIRRALVGQDNFTTKGYTTTNLGWKSNNELPIAFVRQLTLMSNGEVSSVVQDSKGFHILKLLNKRGSVTRSQEQVRARHILINDPSAKGRQKATTLRNRIAAGEDFAVLAKANSADPGSAISGGDLGWATPSNYVPQFAATVKSSPINSLSQPVKTKFGWHIIQVMERRTVDNSRDAIRASAKQLLSKTKGEDRYETWLKGIRDDAYVEYRINL